MERNKSPSRQELFFSSNRRTLELSLRLSFTKIMIPAAIGMINLLAGCTTPVYQDVSKAIPPSPGPPTATGSSVNSDISIPSADSTPVPSPTPPIRHTETPTRIPTLFFLLQLPKY